MTKRNVNHNENLVLLLAFVVVVAFAVGIVQTIAGDPCPFMGNLDGTIAECS